MIETCEQMIQLCQFSPHSEAQSGATANPFFPHHRGLAQIVLPNWY
jgi:hypothetical protein